MKTTKRSARNAEKNTSITKTTTGHAALISASGVERCGGAVAKMSKMHLGVNSANMNARKMKTMRLQKLRTRRSINKIIMSDADVARKLGIRLSSAQEIQT